MTEQLTRDEAIQGAKEQFDILQSQRTPVPSLRRMLLKAFMDKIVPPLSNEEVERHFKVSHAELGRLIELKP
jgi:hypothetical protein